MVNSSSLIKKGLILSSLMMIVVGSMVPGITHAADGLFGQYFQRMTGSCPPGSMLIGFVDTPTPDANFGDQICVNTLGTPPGYTAPQGQAVIGLTSTGALKYGPLNWKNMGSNIYYTGANVGIGMTTPRTKLDVGGEIATTSRITLTQNTSMISPTWHIDNSTDVFRIFRQPDISTAGTTFVYIRNDGNVGIGKSLPNAKLDVSGDIIVNDIAVGRGGGNILTNTSLGYLGLSSNTTGLSNTAIGGGALQYNTMGLWNTAGGTSSLNYNTSGNYNTAQGANALVFNTSGNYNTAQGTRALQYNNIGNFNVAIGSDAGFNAIGDKNTLIGTNAGRMLTSGSDNIAIGYQAQLPSSTGSHQMSIGNIIYATGVTGGGNGNVGIGTISPVTKLDVNGGIRVNENANVYGNILMNGSNSWILHTPDDGRRMLYLGAGSNGEGWEFTQSFRFDQNGNMGIGADPWDALGWNGSLYVDGGIRGARYYDDNTDYYIDSNSTSIMNQVNVTRLRFPDGSEQTTAAGGGGGFGGWYSSCSGIGCTSSMRRINPRTGGYTCPSGFSAIPGQQTYYDGCRGRGGCWGEYTYSPFMCISNS